jgi:hypothetical protein
MRRHQQAAPFWSRHLTGKSLIDPLLKLPTYSEKIE